MLSVQVPLWAGLLDSLWSFPHTLAVSWWGGLKAVLNYGMDYKLVSLPRRCRQNDLLLWYCFKLTFALSSLAEWYQWLCSLDDQLSLPCPLLKPCWAMQLTGVSARLFGWVRLGPILSNVQGYDSGSLLWQWLGEADKACGLVRLFVWGHDSSISVPCWVPWLDWATISALQIRSSSGWKHYLGAQVRNSVQQAPSIGCYKPLLPSPSKSDSQWSVPTDSPMISVRWD